MKKGRPVWLSVFWVVLGAALSLGCLAGLADAYWGSFGAALIAVGGLQLARQIRYHMDADYREKVDVENGDERNRYLSGKALAWAGYWFVLLGALGSVGFFAAGWKELSVFCGGSVCLMMLLYWFSYLYLRRKY